MARSPARATASRAPAITTWPAPFRFAGLTTSPLGRLGARLRDLLGVEAEDRRHRAVADRHRLLHVAAAPAHEPQRVGKRERARRDVGGVLAEAVPGDEGRLEPRDASSRAAAMLTARIAGCVFSVSVS